MVKSVSFIYCHIFNKRHWDTKGGGSRPREFWGIGHESSPWLVPSNGGGNRICLWLRDIFYMGLKGTTSSLLQEGPYVHPTRGPWFPESILELGSEDSNVSAGSTRDHCLLLKAQLGIYVWISLPSSLVCKIMVALVTLIRQELWQNKSHLTRSLAPNEASTSISYYGEHMHVWEKQRARARAQNSQGSGIQEFLIKITTLLALK